MCKYLLAFLRYIQLNISNLLLLLIALQYNRISEELEMMKPKTFEGLMVCQQHVITASRSPKLTNGQKEKYPSTTWI